MLEANGFGEAREYTLLPHGGGAVITYLLGADAVPSFQPAGLLTSVELAGEWLSALDPPDRAAAIRDLRHAAAACVGPAAVTVSPFGYSAGITFGTPQSLPSAVRAVETAAGRWHAGSCAILYVDWRDRDLRAHLEQAGYVGWVCGARSELRIAWDSMDGYLAALRAPRRAKVRREMRAFERSGIQIAISDLPDDCGELARLAALQQRKHGAEYDPDFEQMVLENYRRWLGSACFAVCGRRDGRTVGFELVFRDGDSWHVGMCGWDPDLSDPREYAYFNVGYYGLIAAATAYGITRIDYGLEAYEAKVNRGCHLEPLWSFVKMRIGSSASVRDAARWQLLGYQRAWGDIAGDPSAWQPAAGNHPGLKQPGRAIS
jgi:hypothetical protein